MRKENFLSVLFFIVALVMSYIPLALPKIVLDFRLWFFLSGVSFLAFNWKDCWEKTYEQQWKWLVHLLGAHFVIYQVLNFYGINLSGADFSHFDYALWNTFNGNILDVSIGEDSLYYENLLGNHFSPSIIILGLPFLFSDSHLVLPVVQGALGWLSLILARLIILQLNNRSGVKEIILWLALPLNLFFLEMMKFEFHHEIAFLPLTLGMFLTYLRRDWVSTGILVVLTYLLKEDSAILFVGIFMAMFFWNKPNKKQRIISALGIVFSLGFFVITMKVLMPLFHKEGFAPDSSSFVGFWGKYGSNIIELIQGAVTHPHWVLGDVFLNKGTWKFLISWFFLPLLSFSSLAALPNLIMLSMATAPLKLFGLYYCAPMLAPAFIGMIEGVKKLEGKTYVRYILVGLFSISCLLGVGKYRLPKPDPNISAIQKTMRKWNDSFGESEKRIFMAGHLLPMTPYRSDLKRIYTQNFYQDTDKISFIIFFRDRGSFPFDKNYFSKLEKTLLESGKFSKWKEESGVVFLKKI